MYHTSDFDAHYNDVVIKRYYDKKTFWQFSPIFLLSPCELKTSIYGHLNLFRKTYNTNILTKNIILSKCLFIAIFFNRNFGHQNRSCDASLILTKFSRTINEFVMKHLKALFLGQFDRYHQVWNIWSWSGIYLIKIRNQRSRQKSWKEKHKRNSKKFFKSDAILRWPTLRWPLQKNNWFLSCWLSNFWISSPCPK